ncbi:uncharacterized protein LOC125446600 [Stegostoma tigrinum]|uniref:uncharacterized protein LOC125446600 n=1 Tax=Stegostoma tigrinum TaxID=3053191 RepID=UPI00202B6432|nr:uncharacterized protein LOC125446600 [Stegostoma tigrinum]
MCNLFQMLFVLGYFLQWSTVQAEMNIYCIPGSSVSFSGVDEEQKNKAEFFQWKLTHGNTDIPVLQFHKGDRRPPLLKKYDGRLDVFPLNGSFVLHNLTTSDQGLYTLHINLQNITVQAIRLWVMDKLSNPSIFSNSTFIASTIMLTCNVSGQPHEYQWQKDGANISQHHQLVDGNRSLIIPNARKDDCGMYACVIINPVSSVWADYTVTIYGIPQEQYIIVVASVVGLVFSAVSFTGQIVRCCLNKLFTQQALLIFLLILFAGNSTSLVATCIALIFWIYIKGATSVSVVALVSVSIILVFTMVGIITISNLDWLCIRGFLDNTSFRGLLDGSAPLASLIVIAISITILVEEISQNNQGCSATSLTWSILGPSLVIGLLIILVPVAIWRYTRNERNGDTACEDAQQQAGESVELCS